MTVSKQRKTAHIIDTVEDLQIQIDGKAANSHNHVIGDVTGLQTALDGKSATDHNHDSDYAATNHNHDGTYQPAGSYAAASHSHVIGDVTGLQTALNGKSATNHNHDSDYAAAGDTHARASSSSDGFMSSTQAVRVNNMRQNAGAGLTKDSSQRFAHADTSSVADANNSGATVIQDLSFDTYGHVQNHGSVEVTPSLIGAAASDHNHDSDYASASHNHDGDYAAANHNHDSSYAAATHNHDSSYAAANHTHDLSDINVDAGLDMSSNSITNVTNLSSNSLVLGSTGTLVSSATWAQSGATTFSGDVTINDSNATISDGTLTIQSDNPSSTPPTFNLHTLNSSGAVYRGFTMGHNSSDPRKFEIFFPNTSSTGGKAKVIHQDTDGSIFIQPKETANGVRFTDDGSVQFGWSGGTGASELLGPNKSKIGTQFRHDGWTAISTSHTKGIDLNMRVTAESDGTYPQRDAVYFRHNGNYAGSFRYNSSQAVYLNTPSDERLKEDIEDLTNALEAISALSPKTYRYKNGGDERTVGLIAQQVEQIESLAPSITRHDDLEIQDLRSINYSFFIPHLIGAVKELSQKIYDLEQRLSQIKA